MITKHMHSFLSCLALACLAAALPARAADVYPSQPIRIVVPFAPGGGTDGLARRLSVKLTEYLGQQVIIENKGGGNTLIGTESVVRAAPDGYTLLLQTNNLTVNPTLYEGRINFNTLADLAPVTHMVTSPHVLVVHPSVPAKSLAEFVDYAKKNPGKLTFASGGSGTVNHLAGEMLKVMAGINMVHVPYKSSGPAITDLLGGHTQVLFAGMSTVLGHIKEGRLRPIAVTTMKRFHVVKDLPTIAELGFPGYEFGSWIGILVPAATPRPIIDRLRTEIVRALNDPATRAMIQDGYDIVGSTPEQFGAFLKADVEKQAKLVRISGAKVD